MFDGLKFGLIGKTDTARFFNWLTGLTRKLKINRGLFSL